MRQKVEAHLSSLLTLLCGVVSQVRFHDDNEGAYYNARVDAVREDGQVSGSVGTRGISLWHVHIVHTWHIVWHVHMIARYAFGPNRGTHPCLFLSICVSSWR